MSNENELENAAEELRESLAPAPAPAAAPETQPAGTSGANLAPEHPDEPKRRKKRARHEAGHAVGVDEYGGETLSINISKTNDKPWKTETKWPPFEDAEAHVKLFERAITVVAGPIAEKQLDQEVGIGTRLVSEMVTEGNLDGTDRNFASMDVAQTLHYLGLIGQRTRAKIQEAEQRARDLLEARKDHLDELTKQLDEHHYLEAPEIRKALGK